MSTPSILSVIATHTLHMNTEFFLSKRKNTNGESNPVLKPSGNFPAYNENVKN